MLTRSIWGAVFVIVVVGAFILGDYFAATILGVFMGIGMFEFYRFFEQDKTYQPYKIIGFLGGIALFLGHVLQSLEITSFNPLLLIIPVLFLPFIAIVVDKTENPLINLGLTIFAWIYVVLPFLFMYMIYAFPHGNENQWLYIIGFLILVWSNDTFAYLSGYFFGKNKLIERISPKKTWEGAIGGFLMTIVMGLLFAFFTEGNYLFWGVAGALVSPLSVVGDLIESKFKRIVKVKDSGKILPGHGGVLDRFDASMYAAPFFYWAMILFL